MNRISFYCEGNIPEDLNQLLKLANDTANKVMNLVEDKVGPVVQIENFQKGRICCTTTVDGVGASVSVYSEDETFLFEITLLSDFDIGWQVQSKTEQLVVQCEKNIRYWLEVQK